MYQSVFCIAEEIGRDEQLSTYLSFVPQEGQFVRVKDSAQPPKHYVGQVHHVCIVECSDFGPTVHLLIKSVVPIGEQNAPTFARYYATEWGRQKREDEKSNIFPG